MLIHDGIDSLPAFRHPVVTSGTFDGVHIGHRAILRKIINVAKEKNGESILITFWPHPRRIINPGEEIKMLSSFEEKVQLLEEVGLDHIIKIEFTREFASLTSHEFIQKVLVEKIGTEMLVIGYDHRFGRNREGSFEYLREHAHEYGFKIEEIPEQDIDDVAVSSSKIRKALMEGSLDIANEYLGQYYTITGIVVHGDKIGRQLQYPTANIVPVEETKLIPAHGVYATLADVGGQRWPSMTYIGPRPTLNREEVKIEVYLFDFDGDLYDKALTLSFIQRTREDIKFDSMEELKKQLQIDEEMTRKVLNDIIV